MTAYLLLNHLLNFIAPAAFTALMLGVLSRFFAGFLEMLIGHHNTAKGISIGKASLRCAGVALRHNRHIAAHTKKKPNKPIAPAPDQISKIT